MWRAIRGRCGFPPDNPFVNTAGARGEIWAYGLRNPWRFSFDRATGDLWIADVGQDTYEEVDFQPAASRGGENYGWNRMEGLHCYQAGCQMQGLTLPIAEYSHAAGACSVSGGFVYRGRVSPGLRGIYLYGDYCSGQIWGVERQGNGWTNRQLLASGFTITTFGEDEAGEVYVANAGNGSVHHIEGSRAPRFSAASVVNAASFAGGMVAGSLATVFAAGVRDDAGTSVADRVPLPNVLAGVSVTVAGIAAPVYSVSNVNGQEQVNFQVPFAVAGRSTAAVIVTRDGQASASVDVPVTAVQPGVYTSRWDAGDCGAQRGLYVGDRRASAGAGRVRLPVCVGLGSGGECAGGWRGRPGVAARDGDGRRAGDARRLALRGAVRRAGAGIRRRVPGEFPCAGRARPAGRRISSSVRTVSRLRRYGRTYGRKRRQSRYFFFDNGGAVGGVVGGVPVDLPSSTTSPNLMVDRPSYFL